MMKSFSKALRSLVMGKADIIKPAAKRKIREKAPPRDKQIGALRETAERVMTPERRKLIEEAMRVHRAKSKVLDDLKDDDKKKLYAAAIKAFLHEDDGKNRS